mgnify:FL=1
MKKIISGKKFGFYAGEKLKSLTNNQLNNLKQETAQIACEEMFVIAVQAMKDTFKDNISNEQMEYFLKRLQYLLNCVGQQKVLISTLINVIEAENNIKYDADKKEWYNLDKIDN